MTQTFPSVPERFWDFWLSRYRWYRRLAGGHWELWTIDDGPASVWDDGKPRSLWRHLDRCSLASVPLRRPADAIGPPLCEQYDIDRGTQ